MLKPVGGYPIVNDTVRMTIPLNFGTSALFYIINKTKAKLTLNYMFQTLDTPKGWQFSNCDNLNCFAGINFSGKMVPMDTLLKDTLKGNSFTLDVNPWNNIGTATLTVKFSDSANVAPPASITYIFNAVQTGIETAPKPVNVSLFPNPAGNNIHIGGIADKVYSNLEIISMTGAKVYTQNNIRVEDDLNVSSLSPGIYIVQFSDNSGNLFQGRFQKTN